MNTTSVKLASKETVLFQSCAHIGNPNVHLEGLNLFFERARKHKWVQLGDFIESIMPGDPRFNVSEHTEATLSCIDTAIKYTQKARRTCVGLIVGNHEYKLSAKIGNVTEQIANGASVPYGGHTLAIHFHTAKNATSTLCAHGAGNIGSRTVEAERNDANNKIKLRSILRPFEFDLKVIGHFHRIIVAEPVAENRLSVNAMLESKRRPVLTRPEWCVACPSLFSNYHIGGIGSYAEAKLYPPTDMGWMEVDFRDGLVEVVRAVNESGETIATYESKVY